ncbi:type I-E CRISPR-associated protein Cse1/CasA [Kitasatospora sp. NPDC059146]|uniref:type I-E CRISPR-associated protein Cse1/CasA n=1 Tax=unclassified Kitasatospora TaxID=2633591 RepID=UPI0036B3805C
MTPSFNLSESGWLPVRDLDTGTHREVGLREALVRAHRLHLALVPGQELAVLLRVLLAAYDAAAGPADTAQWQHARRAETLDTTRIDAYLDQWHHRLDLFDPKHPAFQNPHLTEYPRGPEVLHPSYLMSETGRNFFGRDTTGPGTPPLPAPLAARRLLVLLGYDVSSIKAAAGGGRTYGAQVPPAADSVHVSVDGNLNLKDLLLLNLPPQPRTPGDRPVWEQATQPPATGEARAALGRMDLWTWPARSMRLHADDNGDVTAVAWHDGTRLEGKAAERWTTQRALDPLTAWRTTKSLGITAPALATDQHGTIPPWTGVLLMSSHHGPAVLQHLRAACERGDIPGDTPLRLAVSDLTHGNEHRTTVACVPAASVAIGRARLWQGEDARRRDLLAWAAGMPEMTVRAMRHGVHAAGLPDHLAKENLNVNPDDAAWRRLVDAVDSEPDPGLYESWRSHLLTHDLRRCMDALPPTSRNTGIKAGIIAEQELRRLAGKACVLKYAAEFAAATGARPAPARPAAARGRAYTAWGESKTLPEWADDGRCLVALATLRQRMRNEEMDLEAALTTPSQKARTAQ